eukprot:CAMPEP_0181365754 /NCGR_PEP_ID=MMETSP1106-20121128/10276_1 /TAXON_ID=81844 /ORGANISM="Mantoniella antarctica, Strain SL-175" /LENGTH=65 /DNA_ID=CAMNT_0023480931 /DNA_START=487 /DNA_END=684 /DNA_ORIENTATION=+
MPRTPTLSWQNIQPISVLSQLESRWQSCSVPHNPWVEPTCTISAALGPTPWPTWRSSWCPISSPS